MSPIHHVKFVLSFSPFEYYNSTMEVYQTGGKEIFYFVRIRKRKKKGSNGAREGVTREQ